MNFAGNVCLFLAVAIENVACLWFMREMVYKKERALKNREIGFLMFLLLINTCFETMHREYFSVFSELILLLKIFFLWGPVFAVRKKRGKTAFAAAVTFITLNMLADFLMEFLFALCMDGYRYSYIYIPQHAFIRKIGMLFVRFFGLLLCYLIQKEKVELHNEKLMWVFSLMGYISMRYFFIVIIVMVYIGEIDMSEKLDRLSYLLEKALLGVSHGNAGIAWMFSRVYFHTKKDLYQSMAAVKKISEGLRNIKCEKVCACAMGQPGIMRLCGRVWGVSRNLCGQGILRRCCCRKG